MKFFRQAKSASTKTNAELTVRNQSDAVAGKPIGVAEFKKRFCRLLTRRLQ